MSTDELNELLNKVDVQISYYDTFQMTLKILMNSLYGALANKYFPLFNDRMAAAITGNGRYFIRGMSNYLEQEFEKMIPGKYGIYNDTDSFYLTVKPFVSKFLEKNPNAGIEEITNFCQDLEDKLINPKVQEFIDSYALELNAFDKSMIGAGREVIADKAIFAAKKKYYMRVRDDEGKRFPLDSPKIKVQGLDIIKGGTPAFSKEHLKLAIPEILDSDEIKIRDYVRTRKTEYMNYDLSDITQSQGVSRIDYDLGDKGIPQGSKCALVYNKYIQDNNLGDQYNLIQGGDRIKKVFLREPNKFGSDVIGFVDENFSKEIEPEIIDYDKMFEKGFLNMLELMTEPMGWNIKQETEIIDEW